MTRDITLLYGARAGQWLKIHTLPQGILRAQFIRFGIHEGERVLCIERLPGGTIVIQKNRQEITIGHTLAKQIYVVVLQLQECEE
jgi:Fe2+ transport system protein FeoA